jgi:hypothetical protein
MEALSEKMYSPIPKHSAGVMLVVASDLEHSYTNSIATIEYRG